MRAQHIGAALLLSLVAAAPAAADTRDVFHFADPFDGTAECDGFVNNWEGHDRGTITNFSRDGVLYRQVGHIHAIETDTNSVTGKSVVIRTDVNIVGDLTPDGDLFAFLDAIGCSRSSVALVLHYTRRREAELILQSVPFFLNLLQGAKEGQAVFDVRNGHGDHVQDRRGNHRVLDGPVQP